MVRKERPYAFLTSDSFLIEVKAKNPQTAYRRAVKRNKSLDNMMVNSSSVSRKESRVSTSYLTFGRSGIAQQGMYKTVKFRKRNK